MYLYQSVSRVSFACFFFVLFVPTYVPTLPTLRSFACMWFDTENIFSLPFVLYVFLFRTRFSRSAVPLLIAGRKPICKELGGRLQNYWCGGGCGGK